MGGAESHRGVEEEAWVSTTSADGTHHLAPAKFCGKRYRPGWRYPRSERSSKGSAEPPVIDDYRRQVLRRFVGPTLVAVLTC